MNARGWARLTAAGAMTAGAAFAGATVWLSRRWIAPPRAVFHPPHSQWCETMRFSSSDGLPLAGFTASGHQVDTAGSSSPRFGRCSSSCPARA